MASFYRTVLHSNHPLARAARRLHRAKESLTLPAPKIIYKPMLWAFLALRSTYWFAKRLLICEPLFKVYCKSYGRGVHTGVYIHWVMGRGDLIVGDNVRVDGRCTFKFAARFADRPTLKIGDGTIIGHDSSFVVGKSITLGKHCLLASGVWLFDSNGHPTDPARRLAGLPPTEDEVKPIVVGDNVWIGRKSIIFPGVTIGDNSIVSAGSVVMNDVPPNTIVAGYPARRVNLQPLGSPPATPVAPAVTAAAPALATAPSTMAPSPAVTAPIPGASA